MDKGIKQEQNVGAVEEEHLEWYQEVMPWKRRLVFKGKGG